jgi:L-amino acid N-acyltransferase YncA
MLQNQPSDTPAPAAMAAVTPPAGVVIRPMEPADAGQVLTIYQAGLDTGQASFETAAPHWEAFDAAKLPGHRFTAADADGRVLGWVAVSPVSARRVYAGVVEHSVYVLPGCQRRGIGATLLRALIASTEAAGIWTIQSSLFPENTASVRLHQQAGFRILGTRERIACHHGRWRDTVIVERRSSVAGTG